MPAGTRILVVDDEPLMRRLVVSILSANGYEVLEAENGLDGLRIAREESPDLLLLDVMMPGIPGTEAVRLLKADPKTRQIPVIMVTAQSRELEKVSGLDAGADDYVTKPFSAAELLARVRAMLRLKDLQDELVLMEQQRAEARMEFAREVQNCLLPDAVPDLPEMEVVVRYEPTEELGGDFYDLISPDDSLLYLILGDAEGHGMSAALWMSVARSYVRASIADKVLSPGKLLARVNRLICRDPGHRAFLPMVCILFDARRGLLRYANAGHEFPLLFQPDIRNRVPLESTGPVLGLDDSQVFEEIRLPFREGDTLVCCTDGLSDGTNRKGVEFGREYLEELTADHLGHRCDELADQILFDWNEHLDGTADDDLTLIVVRRLALGASGKSSRRAGGPVQGGLKKRSRVPAVSAAAFRHRSPVELQRQMSIREKARDWLRSAAM